MLCKEFEDAAKPLAEYLAKHGVRDPIHLSFTGDLYDMVNSIRDTKIEKAKELISIYREKEQTAYNLECIMKLQTFIDEHEGV